MRHVFSRFVPVLALATAALALPGRATATSVPYQARGGVQFLNDNDFVGSGSATHLGRYTEVGSVAFTPTGNDDVLAISGGLTLTAANGDQLYCLVEGELTLSTGVITATETYVGGTGRFVSASGSSDIHGQMLGGGAASAVVGGSIDF